MERFAAVGFSGKEADEMRMFLKAMNGIHVITISEEEIDDSVSTIAETGYGVMNRIVLHNDAEVETFKNVMSAFFPEREYEITDTPNDKTFSEWLESKGKKIFI